MCRFSACRSYSDLPIPVVYGAGVLPALLTLTKNYFTCIIFCSQARLQAQPQAKKPQQ